MSYEVDYNPTPRTHFFIAVTLNDREVISFDWTTKGHRVLKQVLVEEKLQLTGAKLSGEWDTLVFDSGKFLKRYHVHWIDQDKRDWCNDKVWEEKWERPLSDEMAEKLLIYSRWLCDHYREVDKYPQKVKEIERYLQAMVKPVAKL